MIIRFFLVFIAAQLSGFFVSLSLADNLSDDALRSLYQSMQSKSQQTQPYAVSEDERARYPLFSAFTRMRRADDGLYNSYSNASLIAQSRCHVLASIAGHSLLDPIRGYPVSLSRLEVLLPNGIWVQPVEKQHPMQLQQDSKEYSDWALLVLPKPDCPAISSPPELWYALPVLGVQFVDSELLTECSDRSEMICHHPVASKDKANAALMRESGCALATAPGSEPAAVAMVSCKQSQGVSGCSVICRQNSAVLSLGIFTQGLRPQGSQRQRQTVGLFRVMNGELWHAVIDLMRRYNMRSGLETQKAPQ